MKFFATAVAIVSVVPVVLSQQLTVNTVAQITQCQPTQFTWSGGTGPYFLSLIPAAQPSAPAIKQFPTQTGNSYTWIADLPSGTSFSISLKDSTGASAFSDVENIQSGPDSSCLNTAVTEGGSSGAAAATGASSGAAGATSAVATTAGAATTAPVAGTSVPASASPSAAATTKAATTGGASVASAAKSSGSATPSGTSGQANAASKGSSMSAFGVAGLMGLIGAALF